tara:strand:- start:8 stop:1123 length:1116 start_codon:yes stop_codon:yes gene_type:complete
MKKSLFIVLLITLVACSTSGSNESTEIITEANEITDTTKSPNTTTENETTTTSIVENYSFDNEKMSPFTGLELTPELWLKRPRRVLAFKIDNNINARPQSGIQESDAVFEILVEGGMTRFLAFFYDKTSSFLGPIRSARPTDPTIIRPYGGILVVSGATPGLLPQIRELQVPVLTEQPPPSMFRTSDRSAPHNLYADTEIVRKVIDDKGMVFNKPPYPLYSFGNYQDNWNDGSARVIVKYSDFTTIVWKLDDNQYSRFIIDGYSDKKDEAVAHNFITRDGYEDILKSETIVILQGPIYVDEATTLPSVLTVGVGPVYIFNNGKYIEGTWRRTDIDQSFEFYDNDQNQIYVPPSTQWIHVLPLSGEVSWEEN